jgi:hypothetical protein
MNKNPLLQLIAITLLLLAASSTMAAMYKWVDYEGNIQYSQTPPMDRDMERIAKPKAPPAPPSPVEPATGDTEAAGQSPEAESEGPSEEERRAAERHNAAVCKDARETLRNYETTPRIRVPTDDGFRYLSEEERQEQIRKARALIQKHCN